MARLIKPRRIRRAMVAVGLAGCLGVGWMSASTALADSVARSSMFLNKDDCGSSNTSFKRDGRATFSRTGDTLTVDLVVVRHLDPNTTYVLSLYKTDGGCAFLTVLDVADSDSKGTWTSCCNSFDVAGYSHFFVRLDVPSQSLTVYLP